MLCANFVLFLSCFSQFKELSEDARNFVNWFHGHSYYFQVANNRNDGCFTIIASKHNLHHEGSKNKDIK